MPGARRMRLSALLFVLFVLVLLYVTTGKRTTYSSPFYTRTIHAIQARQDAEAKADQIAEERVRQGRIEKLKEEHEVAMGRATETAAQKQPVAPAVPEKTPVGISSPEEGKSIAGRKMLKDGKIVVDESGTALDGVAKVGNVQPKPPTKSAEPETDEDLKAEAEINSILKKGPIIIFSKSYCPYSKKAKNILLGSYDIVPPPYVVELDLHPMGQLLQSSLGKTTGRRTVPNVLINGKSIGGGDDIEKLHTDGKLIETIRSLGGKRIVEIQAATADSDVERAPRRRRRVRP